MRHQLGAGLVHGLHRRAGQFELAAGLERYRAAAGYVEQADDVVALHDRLPAEQMLHAFEQRADASAARHKATGRWPSTVKANFSCSVPMRILRLRLAARLEPRDELVARLDRRHVDLVTSHAGLPAKRAATLHGRRAGGQCSTPSHEGLLSAYLLA